MKTLSTEKQRQQIKQFIEIKLFKKAIDVDILKFEEKEKNGHHYFTFVSTDFQTKPVLFKSICITNFSSSISKNSLPNGDETNFYVEVSALFKNFNLGSNSTNLFTVYGTLSEDGESVTDLRIQ